MFSATNDYSSTEFHENTMNNKTVIEFGVCDDTKLSKYREVLSESWLCLPGVSSDNTYLNFINFGYKKNIFQ